MFPQKPRLRVWSNLFGVRICFRTFQIFSMCKCVWDWKHIDLNLPGDSGNHATLVGPGTRTAMSGEPRWLDPKKGFVCLTLKHLDNLWESTFYISYQHIDSGYPVFIQIHIKGGLTFLFHTSPCNMYRITVHSHVIHIVYIVRYSQSYIVDAKMESCNTHTHTD